MIEKPKRGRPPKGDAKVALTLRIAPDVVAGYQAMGDDWRARMEAVLTEGLAPQATSRELAMNRAPEAEPPSAEALHVGAPVFQRKAFNPQPKPGKKT